MRQIGQSVAIAKEPEFLPQLIDLMETTPSAENVEHYATIVREKAVARRLVALTAEIQREAMAGGLPDTASWYDSVQQRVYALTERRVERTLRPLAETIPESLRRAGERSLRRDSLLGAPSGFGPLDRLTHGLVGGRLYVLAARPGIGKTTIAAQIGYSVAASTNRRVPFFSLEMSEGELTDRVLAQVGRVDAHALALGRLQGDDAERFVDAAEAASRVPLYIDDSPFQSALDLRRKARRAAAEQGGLGAVVVDYLQLMAPRGRSENREREVAEISRSLKALAKEIDVPVIALAQLNRESEKRQDKKPTLGDLRESGAIESDADVVVLLWPGKEKPLVEAAIAKNRHGPVGSFTLYFHRKQTRFTVHSDHDDDEGEGGAHEMPRLPYADD